MNHLLFIFTSLFQLKTLKKIYLHSASLVLLRNTHLVTQVLLVFLNQFLHNEIDSTSNFYYITATFFYFTLFFRHDIVINKLSFYRKITYFLKL